MQVSLFCQRTFFKQKENIFIIEIKNDKHNKTRKEHRKLEISIYIKDNKRNKLMSGRKHS